MLRMVAVGGRELTRRRVLRSELKYPESENTRIQTVIQRYTEARLLVEGQNHQGEPYVEPAHDALVQGWQKLLQWKQQEEESLILQRRLTPAAVEWQRVVSQKKTSGSALHISTAVDWLDQQLSSIESLFTKISTNLVRDLAANSKRSA